MHNDRSRFCYGKTKNALDFVELSLDTISAIYPHKVVPQRFIIVTEARILSLDVDTANSRDILVRMISSLVTHYQSEEKKRGEEQTHFKKSCCNDIVDCPICLSEMSVPLQLRCGHTYCAECIDHWRAEAETVASCPECRELLPPGAKDLLEKAVMFLNMRTMAPKKACPKSTQRSFAKKTERALALVEASHALNPQAKVGAVGSTAMGLAAANGDAAIIRALAARENDLRMAGGVRVREPLIRTLHTADGTGATPLHLSVQAGNYSTTAALLSLGAVVNIHNNDGHSPLELAIASASGDNANKIRAALEDAGATISRREYAAALRQRRANIRLSISKSISRRPLWDLFGCYVSSRSTRAQAIEVQAIGAQAQAQAQTQAPVPMPQFSVQAVAASRP